MSNQRAGGPPEVCTRAITALQNRLVDGIVPLDPHSGENGCRWFRYGFEIHIKEFGNMHLKITGTNE